MKFARFAALCACSALASPRRGIRARAVRNVDTLTDDEFDATHADETCTCSLAGCLQCAFIRKRPILRARCLIKLPGLTTPTTWLSFKNGGVGCIVCNAAGFAGSSRGNYGRFSGGPTSLNLYRLWRHGQGPQHCQALKMLGGKAISRTRKVPSAEALKSTWQAIRKGSVRLKSKRGRREEFVLAESIRLLHREFLGEAASISLGCDERRDRLLVRFTAVHPRTMRVRSGTLGLERHFGKGAPAIKRALKAVLKRFCCHGLFCYKKDKIRNTCVKDKNNKNVFLTKNTFVATVRADHTQVGKRVR